MRIEVSQEGQTASKTGADRAPLGVLARAEYRLSPSPSNRRITVGIYRPFRVDALAPERRGGTRGATGPSLP